MDTWPYTLIYSEDLALLTEEEIASRETISLAFLSFVHERGMRRSGNLRPPRLDPILVPSIEGTMCSHYQTLKDAELLLKKFGVTRPGVVGKYDMWPRYQGVFVRRPVEHDAGDEAVPEREAVVGQWGLISAMTKADGLDKAGKRSTFNARSETAAKSFTFGNAWWRAQHCIIPADAIFEPAWRSGSAVATRFTRADGAPLGIAGLWDRWRDAAGQGAAQASQRHGAAVE